MALYGGALATAGATFAWLLWAFVRSALSDPRIIIAAVIGAAIGELVHWVRHYLAVARAEATGAAVTVHSPAAAPAVGGATGALGVLTRLRAAIGLTLVFGAVATEHFAAHVVNEIYVPFLASVATLFPVGVVFGLAFEARRQRIWEPLFVPIGLAAGVFAGLIVVLLHAAMDGSASFSVATLWNRFIADAAWWGLVGVCMGTAYALRWRLPAATGACLPFVVLVVVAFTDPRSDARWFRAVMNLAGTWTDALLDAPDTPSWFWTLADAEMNDSEEPSESAVVREPKPSRWREAIRTSAICARHESLRREIDEWQQKREAKIDAEIKAFPPSSDADHRSFKDQIEELARQPTSDGPAAVSRNAEPVPPPADDTLADSLQQNELYSLASDIEALRRVDRLCQQLGRGLYSDLLRTVLVLAFFGVGLSLSGPLERRLRPRSYENSRTQRNDRAALVGVLAVVVIGAPLVRLFTPERVELSQLDGHTAPITAFLLAEDGSLVSADADGGIVLWHIDSGDIIANRTLRRSDPSDSAGKNAAGRPPGILTIALLGTAVVGIGVAGDPAAPPGDPGQLREWYPVNPWGEITKSYSIPGDAVGRAGVSAIAVRFTLDPAQIQALVGSETGGLRFYKFRSQSDHLFMEQAMKPIDLPAHAGEVRGVALGKEFAVSGALDGARMMKHVDDKWETIPLSTDSTVAVAVSADERSILVSQTDGRVRVFDTASRAEKCETAAEPTVGAERGRVYRPVAFIGEESFVLGGGKFGEDGEFRGSLTFWSTADCTASRKPVQTAGHGVTALLVSPSAGDIISGSDDGIIQVWNCASVLPKEGRDASAGACGSPHP